MSIKKGLPSLLLAAAAMLAVCVFATIAVFKHGVEYGKQEFESSCIENGEVVITYERHYICYLAHVNGQGA